MENVTNLRQAENNVYVEGILSEKSLKEELKDNVPYISGSVTIKTSDVNFVRFNVNISSLKKDKTPNGFYSGIKTVMNEFKSIAEVGEEQADRVRVDSNDGINPYFSVKSNRTVLNFKSNVFNRVSMEDCAPQALFSVEIYIRNIVPEMDKNNMPTNRTLVYGWLPTYNGIEEITLVADQDIGNALQSSYAAGQTVKFLGDIVNNRIEKVIEIPVAIGKPRIEKKVEYKNDMLITGVTPPYEEGVTVFPPYSKDAIDKAVQERSNKIAEKQAKENGNSFDKPSGASRGRTLGF